MALPTVSETLDNVNSITRSTYIPTLQDGIYGSNPLMKRMLMDERVLLDGGKDIRQPILYAKGVASSYQGLEVLSTEDRQVWTDMVFTWKFYHAPIIIPGAEAVLNNGAAAVLDSTALKMEVAQMALQDTLGTDLQGDGTTAGTLTGVQAALDDGTNVTTYGGVSRTDGGAQESAVEGNLDATGGALTLSVLQASYGSATVANSTPNLGLTTQALFNKLWDKVQPQQRFESGDGNNRMAAVGFQTIRFNNADVVVDSHVASGQFQFYNTNFISMIVHRDRNFAFTGFQMPTNQDALIGHIFFAGEFIASNPRMNALLTGLT